VTKRIFDNFDNLPSLFLTISHLRPLQAGLFFENCLYGDSGLAGRPAINHVPDCQLLDARCQWRLVSRTKNDNFTVERFTRMNRNALYAALPDLSARIMRHTLASG
jgi:hypothetical protein